MKNFLPQRVRQTGFTLIELLVALTIITILAIAVYAALNPAQRLKDAKDARRSADISEILTAIHQSIIDNKGTPPTNLPASPTEKQIGSPAGGCAGTTVGGCTVTAGCADLMLGAQNLSTYLASMPIDPVGTAGGATAAATGYSIKNTSGIYTVKACYTDTLPVISISR